MVYFVLNYLRSPPGKILRMSFHLKRLELYFYRLISFAFTRAAEKRKTSFLGFIYTGLSYYLRIKHNRICRDSTAFIEKCYDALSYTYHIGSHSNTTFTVSHKCFK